MRARKVAITVDPALLGRAEALARQTSESRSAIFSRALRLLLREEAHRREIERYVEVHRQHPETPEDLEWVDRTSLEMFATLNEPPPKKSKDSAQAESETRPRAKTKYGR